MLYKIILLLFIINTIQFNSVDSASLKKLDENKLHGANIEGNSEILNRIRRYKNFDVFDQLKPHKKHPPPPPPPKDNVFDYEFNHHDNNYHHYAKPEHQFDFGNYPRANLHDEKFPNGGWEKNHPGHKHHHFHHNNGHDCNWHAGGKPIFEDVRDDIKNPSIFKFTTSTRRTTSASTIDEMSETTTPLIDIRFGDD